MSLREEIAALMCERYCGIGVMALPEYLPADVEIAEELVNKVLDAAVEAGDFLPYSEPFTTRQTAYNQAVKDYQEAINKLRQEK